MSPLVQADNQNKTTEAEYKQEEQTIPETNQLDYTCGLSDDEILRRFKEAIRIAEEERRIMGIPQARYDAQTGKAYLEYPDGRKQYVG